MEGNKEGESKKEETKRIEKKGRKNCEVTQIVEQRIVPGAQAKHQWKRYANAMVAKSRGMGGGKEKSANKKGGVVNSLES